MLTREMSPIDWTRSAREIDCQVRGLIPWPCAACGAGRAAASRSTAPPRAIRTDAAPGHRALRREAGHPRWPAAAGESLYLTEIQAEGGKRMAAGAYLLGHPMEV